jgi:hypothetical protein
MCHHFGTFPGYDVVSSGDDSVFNGSNASINDFWAGCLVEPVCFGHSDCCLAG